MHSPLLSRIGSYVLESTLISPIGIQDCGTHFGRCPTAPILLAVFTATNMHRVHHENVVGINVLLKKFTLPSSIVQIDITYIWIIRMGISYLLKFLNYNKQNTDWKLSERCMFVCTHPFTWILGILKSRWCFSGLMNTDVPSLLLHWYYKCTMFMLTKISFMIFKSYLLCKRSAFGKLYICMLTIYVMKCCC
jgi:hypothetical protein